MPSSFGRRLKNLRDEAGLSRSGLARLAGVDPSYVIRLEQGKAPNPPINTVARLAKALGMTIDELLGTADEGRSKRNVSARKRAQLVHAIKLNLADAMKALDELLGL